MNFVYFLAFLLNTFKCEAFVGNISLNPSSWTFRQFAAWNFKDILNDSCVDSSDQLDETKPHNTTMKELNGKSMTVFRERGDVLTLLERYILTGKTSSGLFMDSSDGGGLHELHLITSATSIGAVCLDGSTPGIYLRNGTGVDKSKWIIFFGGGAWCHDRDMCYERSNTELGSSNCFPRYLRLEGLLSNQACHNPDFYTWTSVFIRYCDGASFTGDRTHPLEVNNRKLYFRGRRILDAVLDELLRRGINHASEIIVGGRSAGALTAMIHSDYIRKRFQRATNASFRVLSDAGFFVDAPALNGSELIQSVFRQTYSLHNSSMSFNRGCVRAQKCKQEWRCFFPQYLIPFLSSPIFLVNSLYDLWQIAFLSNVPCVLKLDTCNTSELSYIMSFRDKTLQALRSVFNADTTAVFADACFVHTQTVMNDLWTNIRVRNITMAQAFADWYDGDVLNRFGIDDPYPSNPSCPNDYHI